MHFALQLYASQSPTCFWMDHLDFVLMYFAKEDVSVVCLLVYWALSKALRLMGELRERRRGPLPYIFRDWAQPLVTEGHFWLF